MDVLLNKQTENGIYLFSGQPNILSFTDGSYPSSSPSRLTITCPDGLVASEEGVIIEVNGEQITSVPVQVDAGPREFCVSSVGLTTANAICRALRNVSSLIVNYDIYFGEDRYGQGLVTVLAKQSVGYHLSGSCTDQYIEVVAVNNDNSSVAREASVGITSDGKYLATLEKTVCSDNTNFDLSPVLDSVAEYGKVGQVTCRTWLSDAEMNVTTGRTYNVSLIKGYHTDGQPLYLTGATMLQNNPQTLYISPNERLVFSYLNNTSSEVQCIVSVRDSAFNIIDRDNFDFSGEGIIDCSFDISTLMTDNTFYVDVDFGGGQSVRYNVIRPSRLSEGNVRMQWRNGMGGISFFDFTGAKTEKNNLEYDTYRDEGSSYGYYGTGMRYDRIKRNASNDIEYTLQTHLVKEDSLGIFRDLARSERVWIGDDMVLVSNIEYNEQSNGIYIVRVTYKKSRIN